MPSSQPISQIDPFADKGDYNTKEIRNTQSHNNKNPFVNIINPADEKARKRNRTILVVVLVMIIIAVSAIFIVPLLSKQEVPTEPEEVVNPTGRKSAIEDAPELDDPETREGEQQKLDAVFVLMEEDDWEYVNALFETIFPDYLDDCGKYDYYRAAAIIADNFEKFAIPKDEALSRSELLLEKCDRTSQGSEPAEE